MNKKRYDKAISICKNLKPKDKKLIGELLIWNRNWYKHEYDILLDRVNNNLERGKWRPL